MPILKQTALMILSFVAADLPFLFPYNLAKVKEINTTVIDLQLLRIELRTKEILWSANIEVAL